MTHAAPSVGAVVLAVLAVLLTASAPSSVEGVGANPAGHSPKIGYARGHLHTLTHTCTWGLTAAASLGLAVLALVRTLSSCCANRELV